MPILPLPLCDWALSGLGCQDISGTTLLRPLSGAAPDVVPSCKTTPNADDAANTALVDTIKSALAIRDILIFALLRLV
jgi:hypothetical protein